MNPRKYNKRSRKSKGKVIANHNTNEDWLVGYIKENVIRTRGEAERFISNYMADNSRTRKEVVKILNAMGIYLSKLPS